MKRREFLGTAALAIGAGIGLQLPDTPQTILDGDIHITTMHDHNFGEGMTICISDTIDRCNYDGVYVVSSITPNSHYSMTVRKI